MIGIVLSLLQPVSHSTNPKKSFCNSHFLEKKPKVSPPNDVSIFLSLLANGAANQTGKSEKEADKLIPFFFNGLHENRNWSCCHS